MGNTGANRTTATASPTSTIVPSSHRALPRSQRASRPSGTSARADVRGQHPRVAEDPLVRRDHQVDEGEGDEQDPECQGHHFEDTMTATLRSGFRPCASSHRNEGSAAGHHQPARRPSSGAPSRHLRPGRSPPVVPCAAWRRRRCTCRLNSRQVSSARRALAASPRPSSSGRPSPPPWFGRLHGRASSSPRSPSLRASTSA